MNTYTLAYEDGIAGPYYIYFDLKIGITRDLHLLDNAHAEHTKIRGQLQLKSSPRIDNITYISVELFHNFSLIAYNYSVRLT